MLPKKNSNNLLPQI